MFQVTFYIFGVESGTLTCSKTFRERDFVLAFILRGFHFLKSTKTQLRRIHCSLKGFEAFIVTFLKLKFKAWFAGRLSQRLYDLSDHLWNVQNRSYFGRKRCVIKREMDNRVVFISNRLCVQIIAEPINNFEYKEHQTRLSPLVEIGVLCVKGFPSDYMHLLCLWVVCELWSGFLFFTN